MEIYVDEVCSIFEYNKLKCEFARCMNIVGDQQRDLEHCKDTIYKQDTQLEEAAEILRQHQKVLLVCERERKLATENLQIEQSRKQEITEKYKELEHKMRHTRAAIIRCLEMAAKLNYEELIEEMDAFAVEESDDELCEVIRNFCKNRNSDDETHGDKCKESETEKVNDPSLNSQQFPDYMVFSNPTAVLQAKFPVAVVKLQKLDANYINSFQNKRNDSEAGDEQVGEDEVPDDHQTGLCKLCERCDKRFINRWALAEHDRWEHGVVRKFRTTRFGCEICGFTYRTRELLQKHRKHCFKSNRPTGKPSLVKININVPISGTNNKLGRENSGDLATGYVVLKRHE